jgi:hypothetical protein
LRQFKYFSKCPVVVLEHNLAGFCVCKPHIHANEHGVYGTAALLVENHWHGAVAQHLPRQNQITVIIGHDSESRPANQFLSDGFCQALLDAVRRGLIGERRYCYGSALAAAQVFARKPVSTTGESRYEEINDN